MFRGLYVVPGLDTRVELSKVKVLLAILSIQYFPFFKLIIVINTLSFGLNGDGIISFFVAVSMYFAIYF